MNTEIIVALIMLAGSIIGSFAGILVSSRLVNYRLGRLEEKVDLHNRVIERVYRLEGREEAMTEELRTVERRLETLESA